MNAEPAGEAITVSKDEAEVKPATVIEGGLFDGMETVEPSDDSDSK